MIKKKEKEVFKLIIKSLKKVRNVKGITLYGAYGLGYADKFSDMDVFVYHKGKRPSEKMRERVYKKFTNGIKFETSHHFDSFWVGRRETGHICWIRIRENLKYINLFKKGFFRQIEDFLCHIHLSKILYDPEGILKKWRRETRYSSKLQWDKIERIMLVSRTFHDVEISLKRGDIFFANYKVNMALETILEGIFALNRRYYFYPKWLWKDFRKFKFKPKNLYKRISDYNKSDLPRKLEIVRDLFFETKNLVEKNSKFKVYIRMPEYDDPNWYNKQIEKVRKLIKNV